MRHAIHSLEDFEYYLNTTLSKVDSEPQTNQYSFDEVSGICKVNASGTHLFGLYIPISNLKIGDKIKAKIDVKMHGGTITPQLSTSLVKGAGASWGNPGIHRMEVFPSGLTTDFETITLEFVYQGFINTTGFPISNVNNSFETVRFYLPAGYGSSIFSFRNLEIDIERQQSGLYPGTKMYYGLLKYIPNSGLSVEKKTGSHNFSKVTISDNNPADGYFKLNLGETFLSPVTALIHPMFQGGSNNFRYDIHVNTSDNNSVSFVVYDISTKTIVKVSTITVPLYMTFLIIGE